MAAAGSAATSVRFGPFEINLRTGDLLRSGRKIKLQPQPAKVLCLLATRAGELVTREQLQQETWGPDTFVDFNHGLNFSIRQIRTCLGDDPENPVYIETIPRRGYRFISPVQRVDSADAPPAASEVEAPAWLGSQAVTTGKVQHELLRAGKRRRYLWALAVMVVALLALIVGVLLRVRFLRAPENVVGSASPAAYETYLQGLESLRRYDKLGNLDVAIRLFETTTKADPQFALAFAALGEAYWDKYRREGDPRWVELASTSCRRAAELNDRLPAVFVTLGRIHDGTGQHNLALQEFGRALEFDHRNADALLGLADAYASVGRTQEAEDTYKRAAAMRPEHWDGHYRLGAFYYPQGRFADAASQFRRVIELLPDHAPAHTSLGTALLGLGQERDAEAEFKKSLELAPDYPALANLGVMYYRQKRFAESATMTEKALSLTDKDYRLWNNLAIAYEWLGQPDKARHAFSRELGRLEQAVALQSENAEVRANLGVRYAHQHQRNRALPHLEAALALSQDDPEILSKVGEAYEKLGERGKGLEYFQKALGKGLTLEDMELNPDLRSLLSDPSARRVLQGALPVKAKLQPSANH
jgi:tetratricopeptide (TPR) repeat protein/DNA-binding winged helix-turn-helix (wHTH) protein